MPTYFVFCPEELMAPTTLRSEMRLDLSHANVSLIYNGGFSPEPCRSLPGQAQLLQVYYTLPAGSFPHITYDCCTSSTLLLYDRVRQIDRNTVLATFLFCSHPLRCVLRGRKKSWTRKKNQPYLASFNAAAQ